MYRNAVKIGLFFLIIVVFGGCSFEDDKKTRAAIAVLLKENERLEKQVDLLQKENSELRKAHGLTTSQLISTKETKHTWQLLFVFALFSVIIGISVGMVLGSRARKHAESPPRPPIKQLEDTSESTA